MIKKFGPWGVGVLLGVLILSWGGSESDLTETGQVDSTAGGACPDVGDRLTPYFKESELENFSELVQTEATFDDIEKLCEAGREVSIEILQEKVTSALEAKSTTEIIKWVRSR